MKKAILLGANGYLGRHIAYFLNKSDISFIPVDIAENSVDGYTNYQQLDVTKKTDLEKLNFNVDFVFAFAGLTGTKTTEETIELYTKVNEQGLINVLDQCKEIEGLRVVFPSTRLVYKGVKNTPLNEEDEKEAKTIYAKNKLACEQILADSNVDHTIFRICVPYANLIDEAYSYGTIGFFVDKAKKGENITLYGDGSLKRTFSHVADISSIIIQSIGLRSTLNNFYNIGSADALSLLEVANLVAQKYGVGVDFIDWPEEALRIESGDTIFSDEKLQRIINYKYQHSLKEWIDTL